jgi:hypothetical protein
MDNKTYKVAAGIWWTRAYKEKSFLVREQDLKITLLLLLFLHGIGA